MEEITQTHLIGSSYYTWVQTEAWPISGCFQNRTEVLGPGGGRGCGRAGRAIFFLCLGTKQLSQGCSPKQSWLPLPSSTSLPGMWTTTSGKKLKFRQTISSLLPSMLSLQLARLSEVSSTYHEAVEKNPLEGLQTGRCSQYICVSQGGTPATILSTGVNTWASAVGQALF